MPASINWKNKYMELRSKYISDLDMAFRLGIEQGQQQAQQQQALDAQSQTQEMQMHNKEIQAQGMGGKPEEGGESGKFPESGEKPESGSNSMEAQQSSELDQHIGKLESMLGSSDKPKDPSVQKSIQEVLDMMKSQKQYLDMKKSDRAVDGIAQALHKTGFKLGVSANHNLSDNAKKSLSTQHKIVTDIFKSWDEQEKRASSDISNVIKNMLNLPTEE